MNRLDGMVALVTGGASGVGAAVARRMATCGARVQIADIDTTGGRAVAADIDGVFAPTDVRLRAVNLDGVVYGVHAARGQLAAQGHGTIIVTASLAGLFESRSTRSTPPRNMR